MSRNRTVIMVLIFLVLGGYVYFYEIGKGDKKDQTHKIAKVFDITAEDVQEIKIKKKNQSVLLRMAGDHWRIKMPADVEIPGNKVYDLLSFFRYGIVRVIDKNPEDLTQYGLDKPGYEFWIRTRGDKAFKVLLIGGDAPGSLSCYAKVKGLPRVVLLGVAYRQELERAFVNFLRAADAER